MFSRVRSALASLVFLREEEAHYTARFVASLLPVSVALMVLLTVLPLMPGSFARRLEVGGPVLLAWAVSWWLLRRRKVRLASLILVAGTWVVATYALITRDGVRAPAYITYLVLIVYAAFLVTPAAALTVFAISLLVGLGAVVAVLAGVLPVPFVVHTPATLYASYSASMLMIILIVLVITAEYRDAFGRLQEGEEQYRALFQVLPVTVVIHQDRKVALANPASMTMFRVPEGRDVIGEDITRYVAKEAREQVETLLQAPTRGGPEAPDYYFTTLQRADGEKFPAEIFVTDVMYRGRPAAQAVVIDITERMRMQEALRDSEARLRALFAAMSDVILVVDAEGRYLEVAPTKPELLYRPAEEVLGKTVHEVFPAEQADYFLDHIREALATGSTTQIEYSFVIGGQERCFSAAISPLSPDTVIVVMRDVTAVVEQRNRLLAAERARADLAEHLNEEINHRARNNLAMVSGLLQMQALEEPNAELAARLREAVARIRTFVDIHEKIYAAGAEEADLLEIVRQVATTLRTVFAATAAEFSVEGTSGLFPTRAVTNLAVVINELLTNALKHGSAEAGGPIQVEVHLERAQGRLRISVWNSGAPVPDGFDAAAQKGMGLRLVTGIAEQYGASFRVRPAEGGTVAELVVEEAALEA
jgi:PAS domain S-box-containing protein